MAAWASFDDDWYDRDEAFGQHVQIEAFYPDLTLADTDPSDELAELRAALAEFEAEQAKTMALLVEARGLVA